MQDGSRSSRRRRRDAAPLAGLLALAALGCTAPVVEEPPWSPPPDWRELPPHAFEDLLERELPAGTARPLAPVALEELALALDGQDETSVRAAALLGRNASPPALETLLARLERRLPAADRNGDAGDVVAAAAVVRHAPPGGGALARRLADLAAGTDPHPDLEVRVECAVGALALGRTEPIPFLLQVLRIGTLAGREDERDFEVSATTAWARERAAEALSRRAGLPLSYRADAPMGAREAEVRRLEHALRADVSSGASRGGH